MTLEEVIRKARREWQSAHNEALAKAGHAPDNRIQPSDDVIANAVRAFLGSDAGSFSEMSTQGLADQCRMQARANLDPEYSRFMVAVANRLSSIGGE